MASGEATSIFQEGVRIPPVKLYEGGKLVQGVQTLLLANMRLPDERLAEGHYKKAKTDGFRFLREVRLAGERIDLALYVAGVMSRGGATTPPSP